MKKIIIYGCILIFFQNIMAQYTQVPDPNFEQALIDLGYDDVIDGQFLTANALGVLTLNVDEKSINDLTGIEAFVDLDQLFAYGNFIQYIDLSNLPETLWTLDLGNNNLSSIDLSPIPQVVNLYLGSNNLATIDASNLTNLFILHVSNQFLQNLILTNCSYLFSLGCVNTSLQSIDLTTCSNLAYLTAHGSQLTSLDFSGNQQLEQILVYETPLTSINLPDNPMLELIGVSNTPLTTLDLTNCSGLLDLDISYTNITQLDLSNNTQLIELFGIYNGLESLEINNNPNLESVFLPWGNITGVLDLSNCDSLNQISLRENPVQEVVNISEAPVLSSISLDSTSIVELDLSQNDLLDDVNVLDCPNLELVNLKNGNNGQLFFYGQNCPQFTCLVVDDPSAPNDNIFTDSHTTLVGSVEECDELSIEDLQDINISIYPNPVKDILTINNTSSIGITSIRIYDVLGRLVLVEKSYVSEIDVSRLNNGLLFVEIETDQGVITKKIIKQ